MFSVNSGCFLKNVGIEANIETKKSSINDRVRKITYERMKQQGLLLA